MNDPAQAVAVIEAAVLTILAGRRDANPDQPFVDFKPISAEIGLDHDTTRAILAVLIDVGGRTPETNFVGFRRACSETGIGVELVRAILRQLRDKGLAVYSAALWSEDGEPRGAGYAASAAAMKRGATINGNDRKATQ